MKTIFITGCNSGIGKSILDKFITNKYKVIIEYAWLSGQELEICYKFDKFSAPET